MNKLLRFVISPDVLAQEVGGETVLLDLKGEAYFGLNGVGTRVWQLLNIDCGFEVMLEVLGREFDFTGEQLREAVEELLGKFEIPFRGRGTAAHQGI